MLDRFDYVYRIISAYFAFGSRRFGSYRKYLHNLLAPWSGLTINPGIVFQPGFHGKSVHLYPPSLPSLPSFINRIQHLRGMCFILNDVTR